jgi:hypothetical protein
MDEVRAIELRRLRELEKQAAHLGPKTDPAVLIEIQDIRRRYPDAPQSRRRRSYTGDLDLDWFSNALAAALRRITVVEGRQTGDGCVSRTAGAVHPATQRRLCRPEGLGQGGADNRDCRAGRLGGRGDCGVLMSDRLVCLVYGGFLILLLLICLIELLKAGRSDDD